MKAVFSLWLLTAWMVCTGLVAGDGAAFINVGEERRFPVAWSAPRFVVVNGVVSYTPPVPVEWETRVVGFQLTIEFVAVRQFLLENDLVPVAPGIRIRDASGKDLEVATGKRQQRLNGQMFEPLGTLSGRVYFKHVSSGKLCSIPVAVEEVGKAAKAPAGRSRG